MNTLNPNSTTNSTNPKNTITPENKTILLTIDAEDWFQVENFRKYIPYSDWPSCELRVENNTHRLLDLLDSFESARKPDAQSQEAGVEIKAFNPKSTINFERTKSDAINISHPIVPASQPEAERSIKATFFVLGWIAVRLPRLVREIHSRGHEVASHGYYHKLCTECSKEELVKDLTDSKKLLEDIIGAQVFGYRAPSFSINDEILKIIEDCGYLYDTSYNSFGLNNRYGNIRLNGHPEKGIAYHISKTFFELPISNLVLSINLTKSINSTSKNNSSNTFSFVLPWGGGGYFRLIPLSIFKYGVQRILKRDEAYLFYTHPWELDPKQPLVKSISTVYKFRHYISIGRTHRKLNKLVDTFSNIPFITCRQYLEQRYGNFKDEQTTGD